MNEKNRWGLIGRGFNGWHARDERGCSSSGGWLMPRQWYGKEYDGYLRGAKEGCFIYDANHLEGNAALSFEKWVLEGPMVNLAFPPGTSEGMGSFGYVSLDIWIKEFIARVPGVKYGYVRGGEIDWVIDSLNFQEKTS
jgi:hypothetical protein